ncbi:MAG: NosD domain-containing protein [Pirellulales bacterium]
MRIEKLEDRRLLAGNSGAEVASMPSTATTGEIPVVADLPNVLIIGDSISMGYTGPVRETMGTLANVFRIPVNGRSSEHSLQRIDEWLGNDHWDVIHFNWGLHDIKIKGGQHKVPSDEYAANLNQLIERMQETGAELIWATTTPVPTGVPLSPLRDSGDEGIYNEVAANVMETANIRANDLHSFVLPQLSETQILGDVHYTTYGSEVLADKVVEEILSSTQVEFVSCLKVTNIQDNGLGSLRTAIECANAFPGSDTITFDVPGPGPHTIAPQSPLPPITESVVIDGLSDPDYSGQPAVEVSGAGTGPEASGFVVRGDGSTIRGLAINGFSDAGIRLASSNGHTVEANYIGTDLTGTSARPNGNGIRLNKSSDNTILANVISGNDEPGLRISGKSSTDNRILRNLIGTDFSGSVAVGNKAGIDIRGGTHNQIGGRGDLGNTISGNQTAGILLVANDNGVQGNRIGTNRSGDAALPNHYGVQVISAEGNVIGGETIGEQNQIAGNLKAGIRMDRTRTSGNTVIGNLIGTTASGDEPLENTNGIMLVAAPNNTIGGSTDGAGNTISGNAKHGVIILRSVNNHLQGNRIGISASGDTRVANGRHGIFIIDSADNKIGGSTTGSGNIISGNAGAAVRITQAGSDRNRIEGNAIGVGADRIMAIGNDYGVLIAKRVAGTTIGGEAAGAGNVIAHNRRTGVFVSGRAWTGNQVRRNSIHDNGGLDIAIGSLSTTPNDADDADRGPNNLQNSPDLEFITLNHEKLLQIEYSMSSAPANAAYPITVEFFLANAADSGTFLGQDKISGPGATTANIAAGPASFNDSIVATATDADGNTSEFSPAAGVAARLLTSAVQQTAESDVQAPELDPAQLAATVTIAVERLGELGLDADLFANVETVVADLPGATLGLALDHSITIDVNAAGHGWHASETHGLHPADFDTAAGISHHPHRMDLLTVTMHALGHIAGLESTYDIDARDDLMYGWLEPGVCRTSLDISAVDATFAGW